MYRKVISYILTFILIVFLTGSLLLTILNNTVLNKNFTAKILKKENYSEKIYNEIMENFKNNTIQSGLEDSVLTGVISKDKLEEDINKFLSGLYGEKNIEVDEAGIKERLNENINKEIKKNNKNVSAEEQIEIDRYVDTIANIYKDGILYSKEYVEKIGDSVLQIKHLTTKITIAFYITTIVIAAMLIKISKKESINYFIITLISSGMLLMLPQIIKTFALKTSNILILNKTISNIIIALIDKTIGTILVCGVITFILGVLISLMYKKE